MAPSPAPSPQTSSGNYTILPVKLGVAFLIQPSAGRSQRACATVADAESPFGNANPGQLSNSREPSKTILEKRPLDAALSFACQSVKRLSEPTDEIHLLPPPFAGDVAGDHQSQETAEAGTRDHGVAEAISLVGKHEAAAQTASRIRITGWAGSGKWLAAPRRVCHLLFCADLSCGLVVNWISRADGAMS